MFTAGGRSASTAGREGVLPEQEDQAAAGPDRGEGHARRRNQGHERYARGQREEDQRPSEEGRKAPPAGHYGTRRLMAGLVSRWMSSDLVS